MDGYGQRWIDIGSAVVALRARNLQVITQAGADGELAGGAPVVLDERAPAVVLGAEVRSDLVLTPGVGTSCAGQETGQGIAATRPRFLGSAVLIEDLYSLGNSDLVPVHLVLTPLTAKLEFVPALHMRERRQQLVD